MRGGSLIKKEKKSQSAEKTLTPWQEEHARYLEQKKIGDESQTNATEEKTSEQPTEAQTMTQEQSKEDVTVEEVQLERTSERVSFMDKLPNLHSYHNKQLMRRVALIIGVLCIPLLICGYYISPYSRLAKIEVTGNQLVSSQDIINASQLQLDENFFQQYQERKQAKMKIQTRNPRIKSVAISMSGLNELNIHVTEYKEIAQLSKNGTYYPILENGKVLEETHKDANKQQVILEKFTDHQWILATITQYKKLSSALQNAISQISYEATKANKQLLHLYMNDGNTVIVNIDNMATQMKYYPQITKDLTNKGIIDMEVGIFYAPYESSTSDQEKEQDSTTSSSEESVSSDENQENN